MSPQSSDPSQYRRAAEAIRGAEALVFGAGAGMGVDSGLPDFRGPEGFWRAYPPFRKLGLEVHGFDGARQMLDVCEKKGFATDLRRHDIADRPWPYEDGAFDCAICSGVFQASSASVSPASAR